jgi:hypothetical protein
MKLTRIILTAVVALWSAYAGAQPISQLPAWTSGALPSTGIVPMAVAGVQTYGVSVTQLQANGPVLSFMGRVGAITLLSSDVVTALGYTPMRGSNNLSELTAPATARINLGVPTGTSGAVLGFLNGNNTISGNNTYSGTSLFTGAPTITNSTGLTIGASGTLGKLLMLGNTGGTVTIQPQATAGSPTLTLPNTTGTLADGASAPLVLSATTGNLTCPTCVTSSGGGAVTGTAPVAVSAAGVVSCTTCATTTNGGALSGTAPVAVSAAGAISITGVAGQVLAGSGPAFTSTPILGVNASVTGTLGLANGGATGATTTIQPGNVTTTGITLTLPVTTDTIAALAATQTLTNKTISGGSNTLTNIANGSLTNSSTTVAGQTCTLGSACGLSTLTNSIGGNVAMNNTSNYFDGPSVAQGTSGTWLATGGVTLTDSSGGGNFYCKLWDGTTVIDSRAATLFAGSDYIQISLSGVLATPAANIKISCRDLAGTSGNIIANQSGNSKDSTITVVRVN